MIEQVAATFGSVHLLVNNAVRDARPVPFLELQWGDVQRDLDVTVKRAFNCCQEVLPIMVKKGEGKIVNISSIYADNSPEQQTKYVISKNALVGLTRSLSVEFAPYNIQVNMVVPSIVKTDLTGCVPRIFLGGMKNDLHR